MATSNKYGLTGQQLAFCDLLLTKGEGTKSNWANYKCYREVYTNCKSDKTAEACVSRLLTNDKVQNYLQSKRKKAEQKTEITLERILKEEKCLAFSNLVGYLFKGETTVSPGELPEEVQRAISGIKVREYFDQEGNLTRTYEYKLWDKGKSIDRLNKCLGNYEKDNRQKAPIIKIIKYGDNPTS
jgi:hypothetical protein